MKIQCTPALVADPTTVASYELSVTSLVTTTPVLFTTTGPAVFWTSPAGTTLSIVTVEIDPLGGRTEPSDPFVLVVSADVPPGKPLPPTAKVVSAIDDPSLVVVA